MSALRDGLEATFNRVIDRDPETMKHAINSLYDDEDMFELASILVSSTRAIQNTDPDSNEIQVIATMAILLNYFEYKEQ